MLQPARKYPRDSRGKPFDLFTIKAKNNLTHKTGSEAQRANGIGQRINLFAWAHQTVSLILPQTRANWLDVAAGTNLAYKISL